MSEVGEYMGKPGAKRSIDRTAAGLLATLMLCLLWTALPAAASAEPPPTFTRFCTFGSDAGECVLPRGLATDPSSGHIFVADGLNSRIQEFTAWGEFVRAWGWGVEDGSAEAQVCTAESGCQEGIAGDGPGQLKGAAGIAVDSEGYVYVTEWANHRVEKFDSEGNFVLMFGGGVDQGPNNPGDICTAAAVAGGDACGAGTTGTDPGEFGNWAIGSTIAIGPGDIVYVGDENRIQVFDTEGVYQRELPLPHAGSVGEIAVDPNTGDIYFGYPNTEQTVPTVYRLNEATGTVEDELAVDRPSGLTVDSSGNVYVFELSFDNNDPSEPKSHHSRILKFDPEGNLLEKFHELSGAEEVPFSLGLAAGSACFNSPDVGLYLSSYYTFNHEDYDFVQAFGPAPDPAKCPPPDAAPEVVAQFAASVGIASATVKATVNTHYFTPPVGTTTYYVQWGTAGCLEGGDWEAECVQTTPAPPGTVLDAPPSNQPVDTGGVLLEGLLPGTTYRYRFVVEREREENADPPAWIVIGEGGEPGNEGADSAFKTMFEPKTPLPCPNDEFRIGAAANLRDCRAYELVSPLDKAGGDVQARLNVPGFEARVDQSSLTGKEFTFSAYRPFEDPKSAPFSSQYFSRRNASGWQTEAVSPPQEGEAFINAALAVDNLYRGFSPDLETAWVFTDTEPVLDPGGQPNQPNIYRRTNSTGAYDACTNAVPAYPGDESHGPQVQGFSSDGSLGVFRLENKLTADASDNIVVGGRIYQLYACSYEGGIAKLHLVSALPDGSPSDLENTAGGPANELFELDQGRTETLENAVSADGSKVFWTASFEDAAYTPGALYVRLNPAAEPTVSGQCEESEPDKACTRLISAGPARFWTAAVDGSIAIFADSDGQLKEYEVATTETRPIAPEVIGVLGASDDVGRVYFLSRAQISGEGTAGEPNLYLYDRGAEGTSFIATLSELDTAKDSTDPGPANPEPAFHTARVTPDGSTVAFMSNSPELAEEVASYDNIDQVGGSPAAEIYRYEVGGELVCVSCNRTGQRPRGREVQNKIIANSPILFAASMLPPWRDSLYAPRVLSDDGNRIFFEAFESLVLADTNDKSDVYQWEADGTGTCTDADSGFDPANGGCVSLLTSGASPNDSQFVDASPNGNDVFLRTGSSLVPWDPGQIDIYDARVNGGFPPPPPPPTPCVPAAETCQPVSPAPSVPNLGSAEAGPGNVHEKGQKPKRCPKGKHKVKRHGKVRCVKNKKGKKNKPGKNGRVVR